METSNQLSVDNNARLPELGASTNAVNEKTVKLSTVNLPTEKSNANILSPAAPIEKSSANLTDKKEPMRVPSATILGDKPSKEPSVAVLNEKGAPVKKKEVEKNRLKQRKIIAEDVEWNLSSVDRLVDLCLECIVKHFEKRPILDGLPAKYRASLLQKIKVDLPLDLTSKLIPDAEYWQRASLAKWSICNVAKHGDSWKQLFFELHIKQLIENFVPSKSDASELFTNLTIAADFVKALNIEQLHPAFSDNLTPTDPKPDHLDLESICKVLVNLNELSLYYGVKNCGMDFSWNHFGMTLADAKCLYNVLRTSKSLQKLRVSRSDIDDLRMKMISAGITVNPSLQSLDFSHNKIGDVGVRSLAKSINGRISFLNLSNNAIGKEGASYLSSHLKDPNCVLKCLKLALNPLKDEGCGIVVEALKTNTSLVELQLSSCSISSISMYSICEALRMNSTLINFDLSSNKFSDADGRSILDALRENRSLKKLDLRVTGLEAAQLNSIHYMLESRAEVKQHE